MKVLVCGDRNWTDKDAIRKHLATVRSIELVIEGEARGADSLARTVAEEHGIPVAKYPAEWDKYGRAAGTIRNRQMLNEGKPDLVLAFHNSIDTSKGTKDMLRIAREAGIPTKLVTT